MKLSKYLKAAGYDLIDGPVRNQKPLQLWLKQAFSEAQLYYTDINHAFNSPVELNLVEDPALTFESVSKDEYGFNIGVSILDELLKTLGLGTFELSGKIQSGKKVSISYTHPVTRIVPLGEITNYLSQADFQHPNPVLLRNANRDNILVITGAVFAQNLVAEIETDLVMDPSLLTILNNAADGKLSFTVSRDREIRMVSGGNGLFPIAIKANRINFDKGTFNGLKLVTDRENLF
jgi:hypothetical protein